MFVGGELFEVFGKFFWHADSTPKRSQFEDSMKEERKREEESEVNCFI